MRPGIPALAAMAAGLLFLSACRAPGGPRPAEGLAPGEVNPEEAFQVQFNDDLRGRVKVLPLKTERTPTGTLRVHLQIMNTSSRDLQLAVQMEFRDLDGIPYGDETARERLAVPRNSTKTWSRESLQSRASRFTVRLWRWREVRL